MPEPGTASRPVSSMTDDEILDEINQLRSRRVNARDRSLARKVRGDPAPRKGRPVEEDSGELAALLEGLEDEVAPT